MLLSNFNVWNGIELPFIVECSRRGLKEETLNAQNRTAQKYDRGKSPHNIETCFMNECQQVNGPIDRVVVKVNLLT